MTTPTVSWQYDQDPRYGWASINIGDDSEILIVVHDETGSHGFTYANGEMTPTCLCNAWSADECGCGLYEDNT